MQTINTPDNLFHDGDPTTGALGTIVTAAIMNAIQAEIIAPITAAGLKLDANNNGQLLAAILALIESKTGNYGIDTGAANAYVTALNPPVKAYTNGLPVSFRAANGNTTGCTVDFGAGPVPLLRDDGLPMQPGDITKGAVVTGLYDVAAGAVLVNSIVASQFDSLLQAGSPIFSIDVGAANDYQVAYFPPVQTLTNGMVLRFKAKNVNTTASTFTPNPGVIPKLPMWGGNHQALQGNELGGEVEVQLDQSLNNGSGAWLVIGNTGGPVQVANAVKSQHAVPMGQIQTQGGTAFTTAGAAPAFTLTPSPAVQALVSPLRFRVKFHAAGTTGSNTLNVSGQGAVNLMQYGPDGILIPAVITAGLLSDVEYNGTAMVVLDPVSSGLAPLQPISATVGSNALTITLNQTALTFRSANLSNGTVTPLSVGTPLSLMIPSGATLGTANGTQAQLAILALNTGGTVQLGVVNTTGGVNLDETTLVSATAISSASTSAGTIYSTSAVTGAPFRVVGYVTVSETTAGTWATGPSLVQGSGGQSIANLLGSCAAFAASFAGTGYQKLPSGMILQWGWVPNVGGLSNVSPTCPLAFPNAGLWAIAASGSGVGASNPVAFATTGIGKNSCTFQNMTSSTAHMFWFALGY